MLCKCTLASVAFVVALLAPEHQQLVPFLHPDVVKCEHHTPLRAFLSIHSAATQIRRGLQDVLKCAPLTNFTQMLKLSAAPEPLHQATSHKERVEMMRMWKRGLRANPLIIKLDRSLMAQGSQEGFFFLFLPSPFCLSLSCDQISHIWYRARIAVSRCNTVIAV